MEAFISVHLFTMVIIRGYVAVSFRVIVNL